MAKSTIYTTAPVAIPAVKNVYQGQTPVYPVADEGFNAANTAPLLKSLNVANILKALKTNQNGNVTVDKGAALASLTAISNGVRTAFGGSTDDQQNGVLGQLGVDTKGTKKGALNSVLSLSQKAHDLANKVKGSVNINGIENLIKHGDIHSAQGVANILNALSNGSLIKVSDFTSKMSIVRGLMDDLNKYGILQGIDYVLNMEKDIRQKRRMLALMVPSFFISANLGALNNAIEVLGAGTVMGLYPPGIKAFIAGWRVPYGTVANNYYTSWNQIFTLFNTLNGSWLLTTRNGNTIDDLTPLISMSPSFYTAFSYIDYTKLTTNIYPSSLGLTTQQQVTRFLSSINTAKVFVQGDKQTSLSTMYPLTSFSFRQVDITQLNKTVARA